jgi:hypothetical protein
MSQHDLEITTGDANTGITVRAQLNAALQALGSLMSGATAPTTTYPCMLWADTATGLLKMRNTTNTAWITVGDLNTTYLGLSLRETFDAHTILAANVDNTPLALTIAEQRIVGRKTGGNIAALTTAEVLAMLLASTTGGDLPYFSAANTLARLAKAASGNYKLFQNVGLTAPEWGVGMKIGYTSISCLTDTGYMYITGVGFKPSCCILICTADGTDGIYSWSIGFDDGSTHISVSKAAPYTSKDVDPGRNRFNDALSFKVEKYDHPTLYSHYGYISSMDSDGFTMYRAKYGTWPDGYWLYIGYLAFR